jgi:hypothetical protein
MSDEHHQMINIQHLWKMAYSALCTQYSIIPLFHHSISLTEEIGHQKNYNPSAAAGKSSDTLN